MPEPPHETPGAGWEVEMLQEGNNRRNGPSVARILAAAGVAVLVPALVVTSAGASPSAAPDARPPAAASVPAGDVRQPTVRGVALAGLDPAVLSAAPAPAAQAPPSGRVGQLSAAPIRTRPAVATTLVITRPAELLAVSADVAFPTGTTIRMRVRDASGWSAWSELHVDPEHGPDPGSAEARRARVGSDPLMARDARRVQVRIDTPDGRLPKGTQLTLVDSPAARSDARPRRLAQMATVGQPPIVTRAQWGADESWRSRAPAYTGDLRAGFVHHTASTSNYTPEQAAAQVRAIYAYHTKSLKHSDIDYNFVVDRFGRLYEGRAGGIDRPVLGGHTAAFNNRTFAVVALGNFDTFDPAAADMAAVRESIARLFAWKLGLHGVNPGSTASLVSAGYPRRSRYPRGTVATIPAVSSHQTVVHTSCPGRYLQAQMPSIRALAAQYSDVVISAPSPSGTSVVAGQSGPMTFRSSADRSVNWTAEVLTPCSSKPVRTFRGTRTGAGVITFRWDFLNASGARVPPARYTIRMSGTAADGTTVAAVASDITVTPAPGGDRGPCANATRVVGASPAETSVLWGRILAPGSRRVVLTGAASDGPGLMAALVAAPFARSLDAPLLVTSRDTLAPSVKADLLQRGATEVIVVGGQAVVTGRVTDAIRVLGPTVTRIDGDPAQVAAAVARRMPAGSPAILVSPDRAPAHAVSGAALAARLKGPLLVTADTKVTKTIAGAAAVRGSIIVAAPSGALSDGALTAAIPGRTWRRVSGTGPAAASAAIARAHPRGSARFAMVLPDADSARPFAPLAAASGAPLLLTPGSGLSPAVAAWVRSAPGLGGVSTPVSASLLGDPVLGEASGLLRGRAWAPPAGMRGLGTPSTPAETGPASGAGYRVATANASPEPVRRGRTLTVRAGVRVKSGSAYVPAPAGVPFAVQFRAAGRSTFTTVARGTTTRGRAAATVRAASSGRWRIVVGARASGSDYVRVRR